MHEHNTALFNAFPQQRNTAAICSCVSLKPEKGKSLRCARRKADRKEQRTLTALRLVLRVARSCAVAKDCRNISPSTEENWHSNEMRGSGQRYSLDTFDLVCDNFGKLIGITARL